MRYSYGKFYNAYTVPKPKYSIQKKSISIFLERQISNNVYYWVHIMIIEIFPETISNFMNKIFKNTFVPEIDDTCVMDV